MTARATNSEVLRAVGELTVEVRAIRQALGEERTSDDGKITGTGLYGRVIRAEAQLGELTTLRNRGAGWVAGVVSAVTLFGALILMGVQKWIEKLQGPA